jgi:hypothetical protein
MAESVTVPLPREALQRLRRGAGAAGTSSSRESKRLAMLGEEARRLTLKKAHVHRSRYLRADNSSLPESAIVGTLG